MKKKYNGHIMIDVLMSLCVVGILASIILPNLTTLLHNNKANTTTNNLIDYVTSNLENVISNNYHNGTLDLNIENSEFYDIKLYNTKVGRLNKVIIQGKDKNYDKEVQFEIYLWDEGLFSNWINFRSFPIHNYNVNFVICFKYNTKISKYNI